MIRRYFILFFILMTTILKSQEVVSNLTSNPLLLKNEFASSPNKSSLTLPFFDDFSYATSIVDPLLWQQSSIFVNRTYPINPPTICVATFDCLDEFGLAIDFNQTNNSNPSDTLLSQPIDLSTLTSVYFMFFYQA